MCGISLARHRTEPCCGQRQGQNRTDKFSRIGAVFGAAAAALLASPTPTNILGGAVAGAGAGVLAHVATYRSDKSGPNMMIEELKIETIQLPPAK